MSLKKKIHGINFSKRLCKNIFGDNTIAQNEIEGKTIFMKILSVIDFKSFCFLWNLSIYLRPTLFFPLEVSKLNNLPYIENLFLRNIWYYSVSWNDSSLLSINIYIINNSIKATFALQLFTKKTMGPTNKREIFLKLNKPTLLT